jgi:ABC-type polysaccharide/polyol phosphate transport system ATPase subunit
MPSSIATPRSSPKSSEGLTAPAVELRGVSKRFYFYEHRTHSLREWFIRRILRRPIHVRRAAFSLRDLDLRVERGEAVALLGHNGSGKSTVLRLVAGIYQPSAGTITTTGRIGAVIELGAGFHPELTGAENIALYAAVLGLTRRELHDRLDEIVDFAEMRDFLDTPLKYYSSGMQSRLAFSVAVCLQPDTLLLDEVLAVGDQTFRTRCLERLRAFHSGGGTLLLVSHELDQVQALCTRGVWLRNGGVVMDGDIDAVLATYRTQPPAPAHAQGAS